MPTFKISVEKDAPEEDRKFVYESLIAYNEATAPEHGWDHVRVFLRDEEGRVHGGLLAQIFFGWMFIAVLWVDDAHRGGGWGRALLEKAEEEAAARGIRDVWLDTFSFQAPGFYRKAGYESFGTLENYPPGHTRYFFRKRLGEPASGG